MPAAAAAADFVSSSFLAARCSRYNARAADIWTAYAPKRRAVSLNHDHDQTMLTESECLIALCGNTSEVRGGTSGDGRERRGVGF